MGSTPASRTSFYWPFRECTDFWGQIRDNSRMKTKAASSLKRPLEIKRGNVTVKIYAGKHRPGWPDSCATES